MKRNMDFFILKALDTFGKKYCKYVSITIYLVTSNGKQLIVFNFFIFYFSYFLVFGDSGDQYSQNLYSFVTNCRNFGLHQVKILVFDYYQMCQRL